MNPTLDSFGRDYLRLVLGVDRHVDGYIDAYYGPADLKAEVAAAPPPEPAALLDSVSRLGQELPQGNFARRQFLSKQLRAIECTVRMVNGERFDYLDEVQAIYDIQPARVDEQRFEEAHRLLDDLLPAGEPGASLGERLSSWRKDFQTDAEEAAPFIEMVRHEAQQRTAKLVNLPANEQVTVRLVRNQPWSAYNWYLGGGRSLIEVNIDMPVQLNQLLGLLAHEGYPGHHTEQTLKEQRLYRERGFAEQSALLLHSPSAVIAEGIATTALEMIFPDGSHHDWNAAVLFAAAGRQYGPDITMHMRGIAEAAKALRYVSGNAAILLHTGKLDSDQTLDYLMTYGLLGVERARQSLSFITHPLYRSYPFTYTAGYDLITATASSRDTFLRLLTIQTLPSELVATAVVE